MHSAATFNSTNLEPAGLGFQGSNYILSFLTPVDRPLFLPLIRSHDIYTVLPSSRKRETVENNTMIDIISLQMHLVEIRNLVSYRVSNLNVTINGGEYAERRNDPRSSDVIYRVKLAPGGREGGGSPRPRSIVFSIQMLNVKMTFTISRKWWNGPRCRLGGHLRGCWLQRSKVFTVRERHVKRDPSGLT